MTDSDPDLAEKLGEFFSPSEEHPDLMEALATVIGLEINSRMESLDKRLNEIYENSAIQMTKALNERLDQIHQSLASETIETTIARLDPGMADHVVFWLPKHFTREDAERYGAALQLSIAGSFKYLVFVKGGVDMEIIQGNAILLPS